ncbi:hypothetical protein BJ138DRAFT_1000304 [Hygrophoropsis aurantiaca]|uniref:Uncharacterized protein n=1 Tax=Hygrophoropsis aurantiaca TaxID=72124 RepID=A0ACB8AMD7_9AGAM|nr:hypothetical protein BJ138DRAFT_1000304 [Hygrophoropsis aurantiaca]
MQHNISSESDVHPSAVGSNTQPETRTNGSKTMSEDELPPQRHAGAVGLGPQYGTGTGFVDKIGGLQEELKGKMLKKPDVAQHGHDRRTGELKKKEKEMVSTDDQTNPLDPAKRSGSMKDEKSEREEAATIAPQGTEEAQEQRDEGNAEGVKIM